MLPLAFILVHISILSQALLDKPTPLQLTHLTPFFFRAYSQVGHRRQRVERGAGNVTKPVVMQIPLRKGGVAKT